MFDMIRKITEFNSHHSQFDLFDKVVQPVLLYGCEICGNKGFEVIIRLKTILGSTTPNFILRKMSKRDVVTCLSVF